MFGDVGGYSIEGGIVWYGARSGAEMARAAWRNGYRP